MLAKNSHGDGMKGFLPLFHIFFSHPILPAKCCTDCILWKSELVQNALAGLGIHPQNGQRDNFTNEPPSFDSNISGVPIKTKSSLTSGFFQMLASTHHSSLMMPAWGLLQWKMTRKNTYKRNIRQIRARMLAQQERNG
ncbi:hypothetical protein ACROYT_G026638 [Oculina patagonica]